MSFDERGTFGNTEVHTENVKTREYYGVLFGDGKVSVPMTFGDMLARKAVSRIQT
jgi:hypothetical protein